MTSTRPSTPESVLSSVAALNLAAATSTIESLTAALAEFASDFNVNSGDNRNVNDNNNNHNSNHNDNSNSNTTTSDHRTPSPDLPHTCLTCCCRDQECENLSEWLSTKARLESRLRLCAEVGQALLQKHEAYVRRHEIPVKREATQSSIGTTDSADSNATDQVEKDAYVVELMREKTMLEKRLNQALINAEVSEASTKSILQDLDDARAAISRLSANQARATGWDVRLSAAMKERDDVIQERDAESQRARVAESRFTALKEKTAKLQTQVRKLQESLESKRLTYMESSESTLQDARSRLEKNQNRDELMQLVESLVTDNEMLKRDNRELQSLLGDCREDLHVLQEEVEEQRVSIGYRSLRHKKSMAESLDGMDSGYSIPSKRNRSIDRCSFEPLTPETNHGRPLSSPTYTGTHISISTPSEPQQWPPSHSGGGSASVPGFPNHMGLVYELDPPDDSEDVERPMLSPLDIHPVFIHSRGVQTLERPRPIPQFAAGTFLHPNYPSGALTSSDPRSESSSLSSDSLASHISLLLDRIYHLYTRLSQSDALTLTNRLKRQHLYHSPGDVKHLSRSSINQVLTETASLRAQFRVLLEDEKTVTVCTRKEVRVLFRLVREMFGEMGRMRVLLNDVILDPGLAGRISEAAMDPGKAAEKGDGKAGAAAAAGWDWMAPLAKFFSPAGRGPSQEQDGIERVVSARSGISGYSHLGAGSGTIRPRNMTVPKIAPALGASATTVNVEFIGAGVKGKSVTNTFASTDGGNSSVAGGHAQEGGGGDRWQTQTQVSSSGSGHGGAKAVMDIFVGAPARNGIQANVLGDVEPWVVLPKAPRHVKSMTFREGGESTRGPDSEPVPPPGLKGISGTEISSEGMGALGIVTGLSRQVDAVIDPVFRTTSGDGIFSQSAYSQPIQSPLEGPSMSRVVEDEHQGEHVFRPRLRRGLSDSSIHSTFSTHAADGDPSSSSPRHPTTPALAALTAVTPPTMSTTMAGGSGVGIVPNRQLRFPMASSLWPDRLGVVQALSRTVQNFRLGGQGQHAGTSTSTTFNAGSSGSSVPQSMESIGVVPQQSQHTVLEERNTTPVKKRPAGGKHQARPSTSGGAGRKTSYYSNPNSVSGAMGAAALLNSLPAPPGMRDPFLWGA